MLDEMTFEFVDGKSGQLYLYAGSYTPYTGWIQCATGRTNPFRRWRAFFNFDTSSLPDHAQIEVVSFRIRRRGDVMGEPETYALKFSLGTFIGAALDGNVGEWDGGTHLLTLDAKPADKLVIDLSDDGGDPCPLVNKAGDTDLKVWDDSTQGSGDVNWETNFNETTSERCKLYVRYTVPSATVTGIGTAALDAAMIYSAGGTATGIGTATLSATVTHNASATAMGSGYAALAAGLLLASASATASGAGSGELAAIVTYSASGTTTGSGYAALDAAMIYSAGGTAIGIGTARLAFYSEPLALNERTISVVSADVATISLVVRDSATIAVDPDDVETRGPRRGN